MNTDLFGSRHIITLIISIIYIVFVVVFFFKKKLSTSLAEKCLLCVGILSETIKVIYYIVVNEEEYGGYLPKTDLPFHLCSLQLILILILNITKNKNTKQLIYSFMVPTCLIGGIAALLLPTSSARKMIIISIQYFLYHSSIVAFAIHLLMDKEINFTFKDYIHCLVSLFAMFFIAIYLNSWVADYVQNVNFMYVVNPPMSGLPFLNKDHGWLVYIVHYAFLAFVLVSCCYIKPIIGKIKSAFKK